jgi:uncharacterized membrane protein HdeD (DUF308 family)
VPDRQRAIVVSFRRTQPYAERDPMAEALAMSEFMWPEERPGLVRSSRRWWVFQAVGALSVVVGLLLLFDLVAAVATLALLVAFGLVLTGVSELIAAGRYRNVLGFVAGAILVAGGLAAVIWPHITLWALAVVAGLGLIFSGSARIAGALSLRVEGWGWLFVGGTVSVLIGVLALLWPDVTVLALAILLGLRMIMFGVAEIMFGRALHQGA